MEISAEDLEKWRKACKIAAQALEYGKGLIKKGAKVIDVCDAVDKKILELGGKPAWPSQASINHVAAHYTPDPDDSAVFGEDVVCLDVGCHIDGFIGDNAVTIDLSGRYSDLVKAAEKALQEAIKVVAVGVEVGEIGKVIGEAISSFGFNPIKNLSGHGISQWVIHDKPGIPNFASNDKTKLSEGQIIAIEPFATTGGGFVDEASHANIFSVIHAKPVRSQYAREILAEAVNEYNTLPFTTRWLSAKFGIGKTNLALRELQNAGIIHSYPPLVEKSKGIVTVKEKTLFVGEKVEVLT